MSNQTKTVIVLIGPPGSGKTTLCEALRHAFDGFIFDENWNLSPENIGDAQAGAANASNIIITAQSMAVARRRLINLGLSHIDPSDITFIDLKSTAFAKQNADQRAVMNVEFHLTKQAEAYTSIRAGVSLPVFVEPDDDLHAIFETNLAAIRCTVQAEVDAEFEAVGKPAPYSKEPRGRILRLSGDRLAAIIPEYIQEHMLPDPWQRVSDYMAGHRIDYIRAKAPEEFQGFTIIDCADGDLSRLPRLEYVWLHTNNQPKLGVLSSDAVKFPDELKKQANSWWNSTSRIGLPESNLEWAAKNAEPTLLDCRDGDFERVREFYAEYAINAKSLEPDEDDNYDDFNEDDDDYNDDDE